MPTCICEIDKKNQRFLGQIRYLDQCWVAEDNQRLWLKLAFQTGDLPLAVQQIPVEGRYLLDDQDRLFPFEGVTPVKELPTLFWHPIASYLSVEVPIAALPGIVAEQLSIELIRSEKVETGHFLLLSWEMWQDYALQTTQIRLAPLTFAVSNQKEVLVSGSPLPALPGQLYWQDHQVLLPAGRTFKLSLMAELLSDTYAKEKDKFLLFRSDHLCEIIAAKDFQKVSRSAVRRTQIYLNTPSSNA